MLVQFKHLTQEQLDSKFLEACKLGNLDSIKKLLTSSEINNHANIHTNNEYLHVFLIQVNLINT